MNDLHQLIVDEIPRLRRYARFLLRNPQAADDLVQDTLVRAVAAVDSEFTPFRSEILTSVK